MRKTGKKKKSVATAEPRRRRILLVDDHVIVRQGLLRIIGQEKDLEVCGEASNFTEAMAVVAAERPDLLVVDVSLGGASGIELIKTLRDRRNFVPALVLSMHDEALYAERALRAGAQGYIMKQEGADVVVSAIRHILAGEVYLSPRMSSEFLQRLVAGRRRRPDRSGIEKLSDREIEVFEWIGRGLTTVEIAERLHLSGKTIETYRAHIKSKLGIRNGAELVHHAVLWTDSGEKN